MAWKSCCNSACTRGIGLLAYTLVRSEYINPGEELALLGWTPSSWDNRHIVSFTGGKKWDCGWELGARVLFSGGLPYTPYDVDQSLLIANWEKFNGPLLDYAQLNGARNGNFHQVDLRLDRKWFFDKWSLDVFMDIQNLTGAAPPQQAQLDVQRNPDTGAPILVGHARFVRPSVHLGQRRGGLARHRAHVEL